MAPVTSEVTFRCLSLHLRTSQSDSLIASLPLPPVPYKVPVQMDWFVHWLPSRSMAFLNSFVHPATQPFLFGLSRSCLFFKAHQVQAPFSMTLSIICKDHRLFTLEVIEV